MKVYIGNVDWADEGDVFFFSVITEEKLKALKELFDICYDLGLLYYEEEIYWGTNECFCFNREDLRKFLNSAVDISNEELTVFNKFGVSGFDIYEKISQVLYNGLTEVEDITEDDLYKIKPLFIKVFGEDC